MISVLAGPEGEVKEVRWDKVKKTWVPAAEAEGPVFRLCCLDFWSAQEVLDKDRTPTERIERALEKALVSIDGDPEKAKRWLKTPKSRMVNPLFDLVLEITAGE
jgi:hypothetical protein